MTYANAPIREAIFDIRVKELENKTLEDFKKLHKSVGKSYVNKKVLNSFEKTFTLGKEGGELSETNSFFKGVIFATKDSKQQVQFRTDGFTLNFLAPYSNWKEFRTEAKRLWKLYSGAFPEIKPERIALRYINRIEIPLPIKEYEEFVSYIPPVPNVLPKNYKSFFSQIEVDCHNKDYSALISCTIETKTEKYIPYILDIDVYKEINSNFNFNDFDEIREIKNLIFESSITDKTKELFK